MFAEHFSLITDVEDSNKHATTVVRPIVFCSIKPLRPKSDLSQTSHCNIKGLSVREVMRIENMITQVKFY